MDRIITKSEILRSTATTWSTGYQSTTSTSYSSYSTSIASTSIKYVDTTVITWKAWENATCQDYIDYGAVIPNADISGLGVIVAFLVAAWAVFFLMVFAYWRGYLSEDKIRRADKYFFFGHSRRSHKPGKAIIEEITLALCDQQIVTGLGIIISGFIQAWVFNLDAYHWNFVVYLAWVSSTAHLITLSILRGRFNNHNAPWKVRLFLMSAISILLPFALFISMSEPYDAVPVRCAYWQSDLFRYYYTLGPNRLESRIPIQSIANYANIAFLFIWHIIPRLRITRQWCIRARAEIEHWLEEHLKTALQSHRNKRRSLYKYKIIIHFYVTFLAVAEVWDSFMATILTLLLTLLKGTLKLAILMMNAPSEEFAMGFGQILPLLLLFQPVFAIIGLVSGIQSIHVANIQHPPSCDASQPSTTFYTLSQILNNTPTLTVEEKVGEQHDPLVEHIFTSQVFKSTVYMVALVPTAIIATMTVIISQTRDDERLILYLFSVSLIFSVFALIQGTIVWSRRLG